MAYKRLGDMLIGVGLINENQLASALAEQKKTGKRLGEVLVNNGYITGRKIGHSLKIPKINVINYVLSLDEQVDLNPN